MTDRKKPSAGFWITEALVAVLVGYPLSFGPACWAVKARWIPARPVAEIYWPCVRIAIGATAAPEIVRESFWKIVVLSAGEQSGILTELAVAKVGSSGFLKLMVETEDQPPRPK